MRWAPVFLAILLAAGSSVGCQQEATDAPTGERQPRQATPLDELERDVRATDPNLVRRGLVSLGSDAEMSLETNPERPAYRLLLAEVSVELWL